MEEIVMDEYQELAEVLKTKEGQEINSEQVRFSLIHALMFICTY